MQPHRTGHDRRPFAERRIRELYPICGLDFVLQAGEHAETTLHTFSPLIARRLILPPLRKVFLAALIRGPHNFMITGGSSSGVPLDGGLSWTLPKNEGFSLVLTPEIGMRLRLVSHRRTPIDVYGIVLWAEPPPRRHTEPYHRESGPDEPW